VAFVYVVQSSAAITPVWLLSKGGVRSWKYGIPFLWSIERFLHIPFGDLTVKSMFLLLNLLQRQLHWDVCTNIAINSCCPLVTQASLIPRPSHPSICHLQYYTMLGKKAWHRWSHAMVYLDVGWMCGGVAHSQTKCKQMSALPIANADHRMTEHLTPDNVGGIFWAQKVSLQLYGRNMLLLHMSTQRLATSLHMIRFTRPSPILVLQATNAGVRRPGTTLN